MLSEPINHPPQHPSHDFGLRPWQATLIIVVLTTLAYIPAYSAGFIWDDPDYVINNSLLRDTDGLRRIWLEPTASPQWYPLVFSTFWLEYQLWGTHPTGYHINNVILHILGSLALWRGLRLVSFPAAWLTAALFALHPVHVESVAWVTERKNVLSGLLYITAAYAYLRFSGFPKESKPTTRLGWYCAALLLFVLALCSKSVTASLPAALLVVLWWKQHRLKPHIGPLLPMFIVGAIFGLHTAHLERTHVGAVGPEWDHSFAERCLIAGRAVWFYLSCNFFPVNLMFIYPRWTISTAVWWQWLYPIAVVVTLAVLLIATIRNRIPRGLLAATLFFGGTLFPALGFFNVYPHRYSFVADHFQHLASIGVLACIGFALAKAPRGLPVVVLLTFSVLTFHQSRIYESKLTIWADTIRRNPTSFMAHINYALALNEQSNAPELTPDERQSIRDRAFTHILESQNLAPHLPETHWNVGVGLAERRQFDAAITSFEKALELDPYYAPAHNSLGLVYTSLGRDADAVRSHTTAVKLQPGFQRAQFALARALDRTGQLSAALPHYAAAASLQPEDPSFRYRLGEALYRAGKYEDAVGHLAEAIRLQPNFAEARYVASEVLEKMGLVAEGEQQKQQAIRQLTTVADRVSQDRSTLTPGP